MFILLRVVAYYVKCFNMLFLFNQGPYWKQVLFYALYMLSFNKTIPKKKKKKNRNISALHYYIDNDSRCLQGNKCDICTDEMNKQYNDGSI